MLSPSRTKCDTIKPNSGFEIDSKKFLASLKKSSEETEEAIKQIKSAGQVTWETLRLEITI